MAETSLRSCLKPSRTRPLWSCLLWIMVFASLASCSFDAAPLTVPSPFQPRIKGLPSVAVMAERDIIVVPPRDARDDRDRLFVGPFPGGR